MKKQSKSDMPASCDLSYEINYFDIDKILAIQSMANRKKKKCSDNEPIENRETNETDQPVASVNKHSGTSEKS